MKQLIQEPGAKPIKIWTDYVEHGAMQKLRNLARMSIVPDTGIACMPDVHDGIGSSVGTVIATKSAIIPAAVGVDIGCGMIAQRVDIRASEIPDKIGDLRHAIEKAVPHGFESVPKHSVKGGWIDTPMGILQHWRRKLGSRYEQIIKKHPLIDNEKVIKQLGSLGGGNHFIELCLDQEDYVWVMLHSGSRGAGNGFGKYFIEMAREDMRVHHSNLPDKDLAYFEEGTEHFNDYIEAMLWAQDYAYENRMVMMDSVMAVLSRYFNRNLTVSRQAINCHHNYAQKEVHFGNEYWITRKGAVRAQEGDFGIIPGSMGQRSYIVRGKGNADSYHSCSHGAGRAMSRSAAKTKFTVDDVIAQTAGVECKKDHTVIDEIPGAYKDIDVVMANQQDLVEVMHTLKQFLCVKG